MDATPKRITRAWHRLTGRAEATSPELSAVSPRPGAEAVMGRRCLTSASVIWYFAADPCAAAGSAPSVERRCNGLGSVTLDAGSEGKGAY